MGQQGAPVSSTLEALNAQLAPYLPPGSDKESSFFRVTDREYLDRIANPCKKGMVDVSYNPKMTAVKQKLRCFVRFNDASTVDKRTKLVNAGCSKGPTPTCRISNNRLQG